MGDLRVIIDEVARIVSRDSKYDVSDSKVHDDEFFNQRRLIWNDGTIIGEAVFKDDYVVIYRNQYGSMDDDVSIREIGRASYCDPGFFRSMAKLVDSMDGRP